MGFFADVGRSGGIEREANKLSNTVLALRKDALAQEQLGLEKAKTESTLATNKLNQESIATRIRVERVQAEEITAKQKELNRFVPLDSLGLEGHPSQKLLYDAAKKAGYVENVNDVEGISIRNLQNMQNLLETDKGLQKQILTTSFVAANQQIRQINQALQDPKLKPEDGKKLQEQLQSLTLAVGNMKDELGSLDEANIAEENKQKALAEREIALQKLRGEQALKLEESRQKDIKSTGTTAQKNYKFFTAPLVEGGMGMSPKEAKDAVLQRKPMSKQDASLRAYIKAIEDGATDEEALDIAKKVTENYDIIFAEDKPAKDTRPIVTSPRSKDYPLNESLGASREVSPTEQENRRTYSYQSNPEVADRYISDPSPELEGTTLGVYREDKQGFEILNKDGTPIGIYQ